MLNTEINLKKNRGIVRFRFIGGILWFLIPALFCFYRNVVQTEVNWEPSGITKGINGALTDGNMYEQKFVSEANSISQIYMKYGTSGRKNEFILMIQILDTNDEIIYEGKMETSNLHDNIYNVFKLTNPISVKEGEWYAIKLFTQGVNNENQICLYQSPNGSIIDKAEGYAKLNGEPQDYNYAIKIMQ